ncbi:hypothetical protein ABW20_dc0103255 [Dactylellina cionopaga]|nr:hypothetical protein ABW20_dc0103255 [Dactylellina cionopaga]
MGLGYEGINQDAIGAQPDDFNSKQDIKDVEKVAALTIKVAKSNKRINNIRVFERVVNLMASLAIAGIMAWTLERFFVNQNERVNGTGPFGTNPKLWPTYVMAAVAGLTLVFNLSVLLAYCCGRRAADNVASKSGYIKLLSPIGHLIIWGTTAGTFKAGATGNDIWTFSCSNEPSVVAVQQNFEKTINYDMLCKTNTGSWYAAIATAGFAVVGVVIWIIISIHTSSQKKMQKKLEAARRFENFRNSSSPNSYPPSYPVSPAPYAHA